MIGAAIVGLGWWGKNLVNAVRGHDAVVRVTATHTRRAEPVAGFCCDHDLRWTGDFGALLAGPTPDAVVLAAPHGTHAAPVIRAAAERKSVFVEKPPLRRRRRTRRDRCGRARRRRLHGGVQPARPFLDDEATPNATGAPVRHHRQRAVGAQCAARTAPHRGCLALGSRRNPAGAMTQVGAQLFEAALRAAATGQPVRIG